MKPHVINPSQEAHALMSGYRSMLFVSGEKPERFPKALSAGADLVCIDLEDAVAAEHKATARTQAIAFASVPRPVGGTRLAIRLNGMRTLEGLRDVLALAASDARFDVILIPKVESPDELALFQAWLGERLPFVVALLESPLGIERAAEIAGASRHTAPSLGALMLGGADLSAELHAAFDWDGLLYARARLANAARAGGVEAWDVPHIDLRDLDSLAQETRQVIRLGYDCKTAIHPTQIPTIHQAFAPSETERRWASALLQEHEARGGSEAAFLFEGRMVDPPVLAKARQISHRANSNPLVTTE